MISVLGDPYPTSAYIIQGCYTDNWKSSDYLGVSEVTLWLLRKQGSWDQHEPHLAPVGPRWAQCRPHEPCYLGTSTSDRSLQNLATHEPLTWCCDRHFHDNGCKPEWMRFTRTDYQNVIDHNQCLVSEFCFATNRIKLQLNNIFNHLQKYIIDAFMLVRKFEIFKNVYHVGTIHPMN